MSTPVEGGRGVRFRVLGFPVHIDLTFVLVMGILGWFSGANSVTEILTWLVVAALAVLVHELGHAIVARTTGARPAIALTGFGGVTTYSPPGPVSRSRSLAISLAGPFAGLAVGGLLWVVWRAVRADLMPDGIAWNALHFGIFTTIAWSVLNLLPILPLDGGQAMREVIPGPPEARTRRAAIVSLVVLVPLFALSLYWNQLFVAIFLMIFGLNNVQIVRASSAQARPVPGGGGGTGLPPGVSPEEAVVSLLWQGATVQARQALAGLPEGTAVDLAVHGAVMATTGEIRQGLVLLQQERERRPDDDNVVALLVLTHALLHDWDAVAADLGSDYAPLIPLAVAERAIREAADSGRPDVAARLGAIPRPGAG